MKARKILAAALLLSMLLSLFGGVSVLADGTRTVATEQELAFEPLAESASIAYEQHDEGYGVSLERTADDVTMHISAVPAENLRGADKARLYVRTGVALKAGVAYRVSFALSSEKKLADYTVNFDGDTSAAYGKLDKRSIDAGATDRVEYTFTPKAANGELVLRLLLGKTEVNTLRFSNLSVEEAPAEQSGANKMLVDKLNYAAPGAIRCAAEAGYSAEMTSTDTSATMTVTNVPKSGAEVWKLKLMVSTGLKPEPGKTYRFRATLNASNSGSYEVCYNEGEVEKGYDVLYNQSLKSGSQTIERMIYVPTDKENPGELIVQFSLGKLSKGTKVTVSKVTVEEASPAYTNALAKDFALDKTENFERKFYENKPVSYTNVTPAFFDWAADDYTVTTSWAEDKGATASLTRTADHATIQVNGGSATWHARLNIYTRTVLENNTIYRVSLNVTANEKDYSNYEIKYGTGLYGVDNNVTYGELKQRALKKDVTDTVEYLFNTGANGGTLLISLLVGDVGGANNSVTVSDLKIEKMTGTEGYDAKVLSTFPFNGGEVEKSDGTEWSTDSSYAVFMTNSAAGGLASARVHLSPSGTLEKGKAYRVSFDICSTVKYDANFEIQYGLEKYANEKTYGALYSQTLEAGEPTSFRYTCLGNDEPIVINLLLGAVANAVVTVSNLRIEELPAEVGSVINTIEYSPYYFGLNNDYQRATLAYNSDSAVVTCTDTGPSVNWDWMKIYVQSGASVISGNYYEIQFTAQSTNAFNYNLHYNYRENFGTTPFNRNNDGIWPMRQQSCSDSSSPLKHYMRAAENGQPEWEFDPGGAPNGTVITISGVEVREVNVPGDDAWAGTNVLSDGFGFDMEPSAWSDPDQVGVKDTGYQAQLAKTAGNAQSGKVTLNVGTVPAAANRADYLTKLCIRTGFLPVAGKDYRVSFDIQAAHAQTGFFHVLYGYGGSAATEKRYGDRYELSVSTSKTTVSHIVSKNGGTNRLEVLLLLGMLDQPNTFTVSNLRIEEITYGPVQTGGEAGITGTVTNDMQEGYSVPLTRAKDSATVEIKKTPASGMEAWKHKLFIDTGVKVNEGEAYRVVFDTLAENDMDFEVCYNRGSTEKGFTAVYGLHAAAGKTKTVEKMVFAEKSGKLIVQLSLGNVPAPNKVTVSNLRVERVKYSYSGKSALPAEISYQAGDVSYWAHADYAASFTNTADAVTAHITPPAKSPEPWKVKLFLDTGVALEGGKYYKVTTDVSAKKSQNYEICYNNGGIEFGYDSMGGLKVTGGKTERIEKLIFVPAGKKDTNNLMLQFNLGKTSIANEVTISNVTVEEVTLAYADALGKDFSYQKSLSTWTDPKTSYKATLDSAAEGATLHISDVPASGTGVWMVKLFVHTGAMLKAGKSYQVSADLLAAKAQDFETCFNNEETEKGFDAIYGQKLAAGVKTTVDKRISVPASMTDAGELVLQFSVGGAVANDITVSNISVQELQYGGSGSASPVPNTVIGLSQSAQAAGTLDVTREKLTYRMTKIAADAKDNAIKIAGAALRSNDPYTVAFTAKADKELTGTLTLAQSGGKAAVISEQFTLTPTEQTYTFTTANALAEGGAYDIFWQFGSADNQKLGSADVELSGISVSVPTERLEVVRSVQKVTVNGKAVSPDIYNINGSNYFKLRDLAVLLNGTDAHFVVRYNEQTNMVNITTGKEYTPIGGEMISGADMSGSCRRSLQSISVNGKTANLKAFAIGGNNYFRLRDLDDILGYQVDYDATSNTVVITSPYTPERQEKGHAYQLFFLPEVDGEAQPYVGDTMPYYENGTYYIYYLKDGGDAYNHSVYLTTTTDFVQYKEYDEPVLSASREDVQDSWIGTGSVVKVEDAYLFFYTGFNASGSQEYHEKIMVAKSASPTSAFEKVSGWSITPPAELGQKNDFRDPQAYYDAETGTISLTVTSSQGGKARILKYTLDKDLKNVNYEGIIYTDPGVYWNLECSDTFKLGDKWYLTYSGQEDTLWYAMADSRFGPYSEPVRLEGKLFYAAKHVESGTNAYMVGWSRRSESASSTTEVAGWGGNVVVQQIRQRADGSLYLAPVDSIVSAFETAAAVPTADATVTSTSGYSYSQAFTAGESFMLRGAFTYTGSGSFGLAFDYNGAEDAYKLISIDPTSNRLTLSFSQGLTPITEMALPEALTPNRSYSFTYIQDGSVGVFYLDGMAALNVRLYGTTAKPIYLFAENNSVSFTNLCQY